MFSAFQVVCCREAREPCSAMRYHVVSDTLWCLLCLAMGSPYAWDLCCTPTLPCSTSASLDTRGDAPAPPLPSPGSLLTVSSLLVSSRSSCVYGTCCLWGKTYSIGFLRFCKQVCACAPSNCPGQELQAGDREPGSVTRSSSCKGLPLVDSGRGGRRARKTLPQAALGPPVEFPFPPRHPEPQHPLPKQSGVPLR